MKLILTTFVLIVSQVVFSQLNLENKNWVLNQYYTELEDIPGEKTIHYSEESTDNIIDYHGLTYSFDSTRKMSVFYSSDSSFKIENEWSYSEKKDSIIIKKNSYYIEKLSDTELVLSLSSYFIDTPEYKIFPMKDYYSYKLDSNLGVDKNTSNSKYKLFPNPVNDKLQLRLATGLSVSEVAIFSLDGKKVISYLLKENLDVHEINLQSLVKGIYIISLLDSRGKTIESSKILKN